MNWLRIKQQLISRGYWDEDNGDNQGSSGSSDDSSADGNDGSSDDSVSDDDSSSRGSREDKQPPKKDKKTSDGEAKLLKEVMKLKEQLRETKEKTKDYEGLDLEEVKRLIEEKKNREVRELEDKKAWDELKKRLTDEHKRAIEEREQRLKERDDELTKYRSTINEMTVGQAFMQSNFIEKEMVYTPSKMRKLFGEHFEMEDGQVIPYDKPRGEANREKLVDSKGKTLSFDDAIKKLVDDDSEKDSFYKSTLKQGANSRTDQTTRKVTDSSSELRGMDRIAAALSKKK